MNEISEFTSSFRNNILQTLNDGSFQETIAEIVRSSIDRNFEEGGRYGNGKFGGGSNKWIKSARSEDESGQALSDTGQLLASALAGVKVGTSDGGIVITAGSNKPYAAIHQFGGRIPITDKSKYFFRFKAQSAKTNKWFNLFKYAMKHEYFAMPARPYLVLQDVDIEDIINAFGRRLST